MTRVYNLKHNWIQFTDENHPPDTTIWLSGYQFIINKQLLVENTNMRFQLDDPQFFDFFLGILYYNDLKYNDGDLFEIVYELYEFSVVVECKIVQTRCMNYLIQHISKKKKCYITVYKYMIQEFPKDIQPFILGYL